MISSCLVTNFSDLRKYIDPYLLDLLNQDNTNHIPKIYKQDRIIGFKKSNGDYVGMIKYTPIKDSNAVSFHPMFRNAHKIYTLKCIKIAFEAIEKEGFSRIYFIFPACNPAAEKMAKHVGAKKINEIPAYWQKKEKLYPMFVYQLDLGRTFYEQL